MACRVISDIVQGWHFNCRLRIPLKGKHPRLSLFIVAAFVLFLSTLVAVAWGIWSERHGPAKTVFIGTANLLPGDLLFVRGGTWRSRMVMMAEDRMPYSHVGIICRGDTSLEVVDASPHSQGGNHGVVDQRVEKRTLVEFLADPKIKDAAVYRLTDAGLDARKLSESAGEAALRMYEKQLPFDNAFDLATNESVYCSELIWLAYLEAGIDLCDGSYDKLGTALFDLPVILPSSLVANFHFTRIQ